MDDFGLKFRNLLAREKEAATLVTKIVARGIRREALILLLDAATNPKVRQDYSKAYARVKDQLPSRKRISGLAKRMELLGQEIEEVFGNPLFAVPHKSQPLREVGRLLKAEAVTVRKFPRPKIGKIFSPRSLWRHVPAALLCAQLNVPHRTSYSEADCLRWYAFLARGTEQRPPDRELERELRRFKRSVAGEFFYAMLLPQLDAPHTSVESKYRHARKMYPNEL